MTKQELLSALIRLREEYPRHAEEGMCATAMGGKFMREVSTMLCDAFKSWPLFSGDIHHPVPHEEQSSEDAYTLIPRLWPNEIDPPDSPDGRYQRLRVELLEHCIAWLSERIEGEKKS